MHLIYWIPCSQSSDSC